MSASQGANDKGNGVISIPIAKRLNPIAMETIATIAVEISRGTDDLL